MENIDNLSQEFAFFKTYQSPVSLKEFIQQFLDGTSYSVSHISSQGKLPVPEGYYLMIKPGGSLS